MEQRIAALGEIGTVTKATRGVSNGRPSYGDRGFESISLQRRVSLSAASAFEGREPRLSARVCAAGLATRSAETRRAFQFAPTCGNISVGPYSSTAVPLMWSARMRPTKSGLPRFNVRQIFEF